MNDIELRELVLMLEGSFTPEERRELVTLIREKKKVLLSELGELTSAEVPDKKEIQTKLFALAKLDEIHHREFFLWTNQIIRQQNQFLRSLQGEGCSEGADQRFSKGEGNVGSSADS